MSAPVVIALGSNLGDRTVYLRRATHRIREAVRIARVSSLFETEPIDALPGSPAFLNAIVAGLTDLEPDELLGFLLSVEGEIGRVRRIRNEARPIDLDLILYDCRLQRSDRLTLPHPRYRGRNFVLEPLRELRLNWMDPTTGLPFVALKGEGIVRRVGRLY
ncbi:MAG TPA: 2-amino-4-hydroxy-6-hydroxymethyldihydropteridine diphosphokinase [Thermoanaerobaculia bacterium]